MTIILDTDVLSELRLPTPDQHVATWFAALSADEIAVACFTLAEIEFGIARIAESKPPLAAELARWLDAIESTQRVLPLDGAASRILGRLHALPELRHLATTPPQARKPRFGGDLVIAATAVAHGACVATSNMGDFGLIARHCSGLIGVNPWSGATF